MVAADVGVQGTKATQSTLAVLHTGDPKRVLGASPAGDLCGNSSPRSCKHVLAALLTCS